MSVYVEFDPWGRMGNRMFQYAFGYILARKKGVELFTSGLQNFNIDSNYRPLPTEDVIHTRSYGSHYVDWNELVSSTKDIIINSYLQKSKYYLPYRQDLIELFNIPSREAIHDDKLVMHIRETDYRELNWFLGYDYYKDIIISSGFNNIIIVTDNSSCPAVQKLVSEGCTLNTEGVVREFETVCDSRAMTDFYTLLYSSNVALSPSSFSWWPAFLGNHKKIIFPITEKGLWKIVPEQDDIDLFF